MTAPDQIRAGRYELVSEVWDEPKSKPGEPYDFVRHVKGDVVVLDVENARRLYLSGAVVRPGEREQAAYDAAVQQAQAMAALLPPEVRAEIAAAAEPDPRIAELEAQVAEAKAAQGRAEAALAAAKKVTATPTPLKA